VRDYSVQYRIIRPSDGETRWISVKSTIERDENGKAIRLIGAHTDITEQVVAGIALRQSEERFRKLADQLAELNATLAQRVEEKTGSATGSGTCRRIFWWSPIATASGEPSIRPGSKRSAGASRIVEPHLRMAGPSRRWRGRPGRKSTS